MQNNQRHDRYNKHSAIVKTQTSHVWAPSILEHRRISNCCSPIWRSDSKTRRRSCAKKAILMQLSFSFVIANSYDRYLIF